MFFVILDQASKASGVLFGRLAARGAQVRVKGFAKPFDLPVVLVVVTKIPSCSDDAVGPGFVIFAQHARRFGLGYVGKALPSGIPSQTLIACLWGIVLGLRAEVKDFGEIVALRP
jgi:hypothetical protein